MIGGLNFSKNTLTWCVIIKWCYYIRLQKSQKLQNDLIPTPPHPPPPHSHPLELSAVEYENLWFIRNLLSPQNEIKSRESPHAHTKAVFCQCNFQLTNFYSISLLSNLFTFYWKIRNLLVLINCLILCS